jgi:Flp pilus assembly protein TadB
MDRSLAKPPQEAPLVPKPSQGTFSRVGSLLKQLASETKTVADDQIDLVKAEAAAGLKTAALSAAGMILTGVLIAIAIGFLSVAAVIAIEPLIASLAIRLVVMAVVYLVLCYALIQYFSKRLKEKITRDLPESLEEAKNTVEAVKEELRHA